VRAEGDLKQLGQGGGGPVRGVGAQEPAAAHGAAADEVRINESLGFTVQGGDGDIEAFREFGDGVHVGGGDGHELEQPVAVAGLLHVAEVAAELGCGVAPLVADDEAACRVGPVDDGGGCSGAARRGATARRRIGAYRRSLGSWSSMRDSVPGPSPVQAQRRRLGYCLRGAGSTTRREVSPLSRSTISRMAVSASLRFEHTLTALPPA
jgi:hypothetical protein